MAQAATVAQIKPAIVVPEAAVAQMEPAASESQQSSTTTSFRSIICTECQKLFKSIDEANLHAERTGHESFNESTDEILPLSEEEKKERLKQLQEKLKQRREEREAQEMRDKVSSLKIQRESHRKMMEASKLNEEKEMQKIVEQRQRDKQEALNAKQRVLEQIEADKRERQSKFASSLSSTQTTEVPAQSLQQQQQPIPTTFTGNTTHIRIRFKDGSTLSESFEADQKLCKVIEFIEKNKSISKFKLVLPFPRKELKEKNKTLRELLLVPSANLLVE